jgi:hypothetical protein
MNLSGTAKGYTKGVELHAENNVDQHKADYDGIDEGPYVPVQFLLGVFKDDTVARRQVHLFVQKFLDLQFEVFPLGLLSFPVHDRHNAEGLLPVDGDDLLYVLVDADVEEVLHRNRSAPDEIGGNFGVALYLLLVRPRYSQIEIEGPRQGQLRGIPGHYLVVPIGVGLVSVLQVFPDFEGVTAGSEGYHEHG